MARCQWNHAEHLCCRDAFQYRPERAIIKPEIAAFGWAKPSGRWNGCNKESLRAYFPATERVLFAEHYQGPYRGKSDGYAAKERELKQHIMAPLISYFRDARAELGITAKQIAEATGKKNMVSHWFGASQWQLPNEADYRKLQALFSRIAAEKFGAHTHSVAIGSHGHTITVNAAGNAENTVKNIAFNYIVRLA